MSFLEEESESKQLLVSFLVAVLILVVNNVDDFSDNEVMVEWEEYYDMLILIVFDSFSEISWVSDWIFGDFFVGE